METKGRFLLPEMKWLILIDQKLRHTKISANFQVNIYLITLAKHYHNNSRWRYIKTTTKIGKS